MSIYVDIKKNFGTFELAVKFRADDEIVALLGASGCGKSMTLRCIAGIVKPDEGVIVVDGVTLFDSSKRVNLPPQRRRVGLLFQNYALFPNMTVEQNIKAVLRLNRKARKDIDLSARFASIMEKFYIAGLDNHYPAQLSGGQQQRVALARIVASDPSIIMLDEPLSALDSYLRWQLEGELLKMLEEFTGTTLYVSHNRDEVYRLCQKVCVMNRGSTEKMRTVAELFEKPDTLASALLSGCKNYSRIERRGERGAFALDWGVELVCDGSVTDDIRYIGVRAHFIAPAGGDCSSAANTFDCTVVRVIDDVFGTIVNLRPNGVDSTHDFSTIRMELPKEAAKSIKAGDDIAIEMAPRDIMLLK